MATAYTGVAGDPVTPRALPKPDTHEIERFEKILVDAFERWSEAITTPILTINNGNEVPSWARYDKSVENWFRLATLIRESL